LVLPDDDEPVLAGLLLSSPPQAATPDASAPARHRAMMGLRFTKCLL
jgi:hypothetical protein